MMNIRHPLYAGSFYEGSAAPCRHHAVRLLEAAEADQPLPDRLFGGLVPHAGWMYSGQVAARTFGALAAQGPAATFVLFGAVHRGHVRAGEVYDAGVWRTPLGEVAIDEELAAALVAADPALRANPGAHAEEHSLEVQVPLLQVACPQAKIVPIAMPPVEQACHVGQVVGEVAAKREGGVAVVGSTDLTHHGGHFGAPGGPGPQGAQWAEQNDRRMLDLVEALAAEKILEEARQRHNACGAGAVAATLAACRALGATRGIILDYTNSYRVIHDQYPDEPDDTTVGYASVVFA